MGRRVETGQDRPLVFSLIESPSHPDFSARYRALGMEELRFGSMRKALAALKDRTPDFVVAEFFYGYGNNYAGVNISNLDVFLYGLQRYAPDARVIAMVQRTQLPYVQRLRELFSIHAVLTQPVGAHALEVALLARPQAVGDADDNPGPARV